MKRELVAYLDSIKARDPAPRSRWEILLYPGVLALGLHRIAHWLFRGELYFIARLVNHIARLLTAIDIHPGAQIGDNFFIDHGFTVIGENCPHRKQCHDLPECDARRHQSGRRRSGKRHPSIEDDVIIGSGAQVLGPITIGRGARIGANAVVTRDVAEGATMVGIPARPTLVDAETYNSFIPYGTPCSERFDPATQQLELLKCEVETLRIKLANLIEEREAGSATETDRQSA